MNKLHLVECGKVLGTSRYQVQCVVSKHGISPNPMGAPECGSMVGWKLKARIVKRIPPR